MYKKRSQGWAHGTEELVPQHFHAPPINLTPSHAAVKTPIEGREDKERGQHH
jgi:hypothetical protein